jgi:hypothetical protein
VLFAAGTGVVAIPDALVVAVAELLPPNVALAPLAGAANVTVTPETGFDNASVTFACSALENVFPVTAFWGVPEMVVMAFGAPAVLVKANVVGDKPPAEAVTL